MHSLRFFLLMLVVSLSYGQDISSVTTDIRHEVITPLLRIEQKQESIDIQITALTQSELEQLSMRFESLAARWSLISARLNGESLWLIKAGIHPGNQSVLAWDNARDEKSIDLFPYQWTAPYVLDLNLQINLENEVDISELSEDTIEMQAQIAGERYKTTPTGRGNKVELR